MGTQTAAPISFPKPKKGLVRRQKPDRSQLVRAIVQWAFVALNLWLGLQFYLWARFFERGGSGLFVPRPSGAEGWLPIAGLMNFKYFLLTGDVPAIHPAAMFLFMAFVLMSVLLKKAFCSLALPRGNALGIPAQAGPPDLRPQSAPAAVGRSSPAGTQVSAARLLRLCHRRHVDRDAAQLHEHALRPDRRCQDAELLPQHGPDRRDCHRAAGAAFHAGAELLVPLSVPLRRAAGTRFPA